MKKRLLLLLVIAMCGFVVAWYARREVPVTVRLEEVGRGDVELTVTNTRAGTIKACRRAALSMPGGGRVETLHVHEGQEVAAGQLLLELWNDDRKAMTAQAQAQLAAATNRREQQCIEADNSEREAKRVQALHDRGLAALEAAENALTRARSSAFACRAAHDEQRIAAASLEMNRALLAQTRLHAPFAGIIAEINGEVGEYVTPSPPGPP